MKRRPAVNESRMDVAGAGGPPRLMARVATRLAEAKKLRISKAKQRFAPMPSTMAPAMAGATIIDTCTARCMRALADISPPGGASVRSATAWAGMKKLDTVAKAEVRPDAFDHGAGAN